MTWAPLADVRMCVQSRNVLTILSETLYGAVQDGSRVVLRGLPQGVQDADFFGFDTAPNVCVGTCVATGLIGHVVKLEYPTSVLRYKPAPTTDWQLEYALM